MQLIRLKKQKVKEKENPTIKLKTILTSRFMSGKLLIFAKLSLKGFVYELMVIFYFPSEKLSKYLMSARLKKIEIYHILTDTDSTSLQFVFTSDPTSAVPENKILYLKL